MLRNYSTSEKSRLLLSYSKILDAAIVRSKNGNIAERTKDILGIVNEIELITASIKADLQGGKND